jgi:putative transposase
MVRPKRIDLPFSLYHVLSRTNSGDIAFSDSRDEEKFLEYLSRYVQLFEYRIHAYCLMNTHFHLLLESPAFPRLSEFMRRLLTAYTIYYNRRHRRHGHLFQGRFKSFVVDKVDYFLPLSRYIHLNPGRDSPSVDPFQYTGSSLFFYLNGGEPSFLNTREILSWFGGKRKKYGEYVRKGLEGDQKLKIYQQRFIGGEKFCQRIRKRMGQIGESGTRAQKALQKGSCVRREYEEQEARRICDAVAKYYGLTVEIILKGRYSQGDIGKARTILIFLLREHLTWTGREISEFLGIKRSIYCYLAKIREDDEIQKDYHRIKDVIFVRV